MAADYEQEVKYHDGGFRISSLPRHRDVDHLLVLEDGVVERLEADLGRLVARLVFINRVQLEQLQVWKVETKLDEARSKKCSNEQRIEQKCKK